VTDPRATPRANEDVCERAGLGRDWAPRDLRHTFVSLLSDDGMAIEKIARLVGHASSHVTETVYRQELRPVLQEGADVMDRLLRRMTMTESAWILGHFVASLLPNSESTLSHSDRFVAAGSRRTINSGVASSAR